MFKSTLYGLVIPWYGLGKHLFILSQSKRAPFLLHVCGPLHDSDDIVSLREKRHPIVQRALLLLVQVLPVRLDVVGVC